MTTLINAIRTAGPRSFPTRLVLTSLLCLHDGLEASELQWASSEILHSPIRVLTLQSLPLVARSGISAAALLRVDSIQLQRR